MFVMNFAMVGQTYKYVMQAECQMFAKQCLFVWPELMYQSIPSLTIPPSDPRGFAHSSCPRSRVFAPLSCPGVCPGVCPGSFTNKSK